MQTEDFETTQKEGFSFTITDPDGISYEGQYLSIVAKLPNDNFNTNEGAKINKFYQLNSVNLSTEDLEKVRNGIIPIIFSNQDVSIKATTYKYQIKLTNENNTSTLLLLKGTIKIEDDMDKR